MVSKSTVLLLCMIVFGSVCFGDEPPFIPCTPGNRKRNGDSVNIGNPSQSIASSPITFKSGPTPKVTQSHHFEITATRSAENIYRAYNQFYKFGVRSWFGSFDTRAMETITGTLNKDEVFVRLKFSADYGTIVAEDVELKPEALALAKESPQLFELKYGTHFCHQQHMGAELQAVIRLRLTEESLAKVAGLKIEADGSFLGISPALKVDIQEAIRRDAKQGSLSVVVWGTGGGTNTDVFAEIIRSAAKADSQDTIGEIQRHLATAVSGLHADNSAIHGHDIVPYSQLAPDLLKPRRWNAYQQGHIESLHRRYILATDQLNGVDRHLRDHENLPPQSRLFTAEQYATLADAKHAIGEYLVNLNNAHSQIVLGENPKDPALPAIKIGDKVTLVADLPEMKTVLTMQTPLETQRDIQEELKRLQILKLAEFTVIVRSVGTTPIPQIMQEERIAADGYYTISKTGSLEAVGKPNPTSPTFIEAHDGNTECDVLIPNPFGKKITAVWFLPESDYRLKDRWGKLQIQASNSSPNKVQVQVHAQQQTGFVRGRVFVAFE